MGERAFELVSSISTGFTEFAGGQTDYGDGPLDWPGYGRQRQRAADSTGASESVVCGQGWIGQHEVVLIAFEFGYLGGSVGSATGDRLVAAFGEARRSRLPVVSLVASGGSRVQEGILALRQLQRIARECVLQAEAGLAHISVLRHPTTGGMWASLAAGADVVLGLPGAEIAFGGSRVRDPDSAGVSFTAEGKLSGGQLDQIIDRAQLRGRLDTALGLLSGDPGKAAEPVVFEHSTVVDLPDSGMEALNRARSAERARASTYLEHFFGERFELGGTDPGMMCGFGYLEGRPVAYAAQCGTRNTPGGFRAAARLIRLADRLGLAVLTLVDTPGADNRAEAEEAGVGPAIAELFAAVASARVPVSTLVIGEGGSGGALALTSPDRVWMTADAYFAVIAAEQATAILKRPARDVPEIADRLRLRPQDLLDLGIVQGIVEPLRSH